MRYLPRREFLRTTAALAAGAAGCSLAAPLAAQEAGERPSRDRRVSFLNPRTRVPVSLIIDDSTCLVNLNRFAIPQFATAWNNGRFDHDWRKMPLEIPDAFVRKFGEWAAENGVKGKYSIVPYPACVGRLDRELPGWTRREVNESIDLVRNLMLPNWDIHPEMVTHTRVIDTKTGHPYPHYGPEWAENWEWTNGKSVDQLADYMRYGLQILKNIDLPCEGITTPGGFGIRVLPELAQATLQSCRDVYRAEIPHYFRHIFGSGDGSVAPRVEYAAGLQTNDPQCVVSIVGCTGDWTGGWDCSNRGDLDRFITPDLQEGRLVEVIERGEPACLVCHWTGVYFNGEEVGFKIFQEVVRRLHARFDHLVWMKNSELARYWAARELTNVSFGSDQVIFDAPFACPEMTIQVDRRPPGELSIHHADEVQRLTEVTQSAQLKSSTWMKKGDQLVVCVDLRKGRSILRSA